jgi:hypothetical protein
VTVTRSRNHALALAVVLTSLLSLGSGIALAQKPEELAQQSAESWLALVDAGKYGDSWQEAASMFKSVVNKDQWQHMLHATRDPLGKLQSRKLAKVTYTKSLPGAPDGDYVVLVYESSFEHKQSAIETITPALDKDGKWRVSGYFIK